VSRLGQTGSVSGSDFAHLQAQLHVLQLDNAIPEAHSELCVCVCVCGCKSSTQAAEMRHSTQLSSLTWSFWSPLT
jgi:hypothetical protein